MKRLIYWLTAWIPTRVITTALYGLLRVRGEYGHNPKKQLINLLELDNKLYGLQGMLAIRYGDGVHTKHHHIKYHNFFTTKLPSGSRVLEIGCGYGALSHSLAEAPGAQVTGIDIVPGNVLKARKRFNRQNLNFICGDALSYDFDDSYDIIVMSNVLEHLKGRSKFLRKVTDVIRPDLLLIRVPLFERDWRVPLKQELGVDWRLDPTHETEYTLESFHHEIKEAELYIAHLEVRWGEIWAVVSTKKPK